ncbi:alkaline phosphatase family protein [Dyella halodurans]|uniref:Alkaline phosphatase family protein n=1 Tax=Dyella halodurans TaxID=1920171 RepID=A0ABV9BZ40_9GAMM|nr:ectonucleotide pyrophosphatase/phosphodiesterase [Dyella halodurans]
MRSAMRRIAGTLLALGLAVPVAAAPVVLISIDGLRPVDVLDAQHRGLKIPNLQSFITQGAYAQSVRGVLPTTTYPSHATLMTGVSPGKHGIGGNLTFDPYSKNQRGWDWYASDIKVPTLWDAAHDAGLSTANVHWPVSVGAQVDWNLPQIWRTGTADDRKLLAALATPGLLPALEARLGPYANGIDENLAADQTRARFAVALLEARKPDFMTVYLTALDHQQHESGPDTPPSRAVLEQIDVLVGNLMQASRRVHPDGVIAVVSDHGFSPVQSDVNLYAPFVQAGLVTLKEGVVADWQAMPWNDGGSAAIVLRDPANATVHGKVAALLAQLGRDPAYGIDHVIDKADVLRQGGTPQAEWFVLFKPGYEMGSKLDAPMLSPSPYRGEHGYDPALPQMRATFLIEGKGIKAGKNLGEIDMRDVAPTIAHVLGVKLPQAEGKSLLP